MTKNKKRSQASRDVIADQNDNQNEANGASSADAVLDSNDTTETVVKESDVAALPEMELKNVTVKGNKVEGDLEGVGRVEIPKTKNRKVTTKINGVPVVIVYPHLKDAPGRPVNPDSKRQQELAEKNERHAKLLEAGLEVKRGRPANPESRRQAIEAERAMKLKQLIDAKRAEMGDAAKDMTDVELAALVSLPKGRPVDPNSKRQEVEAERELKRIANGGTLPKGRPKEIDEEVAVVDLVMVPAGEDEVETDA
jgi:hypothetical protein